MGLSRITTEIGLPHSRWTMLILKSTAFCKRNVSERLTCIDTAGSDMTGQFLKREKLAVLESPPDRAVKVAC